MRRIVPLRKMDLAHQKGEDKTKVMDKEEGMMEKCKNKVKLHRIRIPLLEQRLRRKRRLL
jgi:hypothetical protein